MSSPIAFDDLNIGFYFFNVVDLRGNSNSARGSASQPADFTFAGKWKVH